MKVKNVLNSILANDIVNALQSKRFDIDWVRFNYCNAYTTAGALIEITIGNDDYYVLPIMSYTTIVGFVYNGVAYEVGKYSRTTSKQFTQICNTYFPHCDRTYVEKRYC